MIRFRSTHPALALTGHLWRFVDGVADVPEEVAATLRDLARRKPFLRIVEVGPAPTAFRRPPRVPRVRRERAEPNLVIVDRGSGS